MATVCHNKATYYRETICAVTPAIIASIFVKLFMHDITLWKTVAYPVPYLTMLSKSLKYTINIINYTFTDKQETNWSKSRSYKHWHSAKQVCKATADNNRKHCKKAAVAKYAFVTLLTYKFFEAQDFVAFFVSRIFSFKASAAKRTWVKYMGKADEFGRAERWLAAVSAVCSGTSVRSRPIS